MYKADCVTFCWCQFYPKPTQLEPTVQNHYLVEKVQFWFSGLKKMPLEEMLPCLLIALLKNTKQTVFISNNAAFQMVREMMAF